MRLAIEFNMLFIWYFVIPFSTIDNLLIVDLINFIGSIVGLSIDIN